METNFFTTIQPILDKGIELHLSLKMEKDKIYLALRPLNSKVKDDCLNSLTPLILRNSSAQLDENFFETIEKPLSIYEDSVSNIEDFEKQLKELTTNSSAKKKLDNAKPKAQKEEEDKAAKSKEKYDRALASMKTEDYPSAKALLLEVLLLTPEHEEAKAKYEEVLDILINPLVEKARAYAKSFAFKDAMDILKQISKIDEKHWSIEEVEKGIEDKVGSTVLKQLKS